MTRLPPGDTPWHSTCRSDAHCEANAYLYRQSPLIHTSRSKSLASHSGDACLRWRSRHVHRRPFPGGTPAQCVSRSTLHDMVSAVSWRMSPAATTILRSTSRLHSALVMFPLSRFFLRHSSTLPLALTRDLAAVTSERHTKLTTLEQARRRPKSRRQSAARRMARRSMTARQSAENLTSEEWDSRQDMIRPAPGRTPVQKTVLSAAHVSSRKAS
mmetsp:Transcript_31737/g.79709  ORF Transcript_31737/g.79709 Transcript_31737/m.79709 type:complete len:214 (+) Transcript_31737:1493-2134(+)